MFLTPQRRTQRALLAPSSPGNYYLRRKLLFTGAHAAGFASTILALLLSVGSEWDGVGVRNLNPN
jgi:hypothetical protein